MSAAKESVLQHVSMYRDGRSSLQKLAWAIDAYRANRSSDANQENVDEIYFLVEELNAHCKFRNRALSLAENTKIIEALEVLENIILSEFS